MRYSIKPALRPGTGEERTVRLRVSWAGARLDLAAGVAVPEDMWDAAAGRALSRFKHARQVNKAIMTLSASVEEALVRFEMDHGRAPTVAELRVALGPAAPGRKAGAPSRTGFFETFDDFVRLSGSARGWTQGTYDKFRALRAHLREWRGDLSLETFSKEDFASFTRHLSRRAGMRDTTLAKQVGLVKWFLKWAASEGRYKGNAHVAYRPRFKGLGCKEVIYLEWEELERLLAHPLAGHPGLAATRDVFCFCCLTGLRYSDAVALRGRDVHLEASPPYIEVVTRKTSDRLRIELNRRALELLERWRGKGLPRGAALPGQSNQVMNRNLHELARLAGIDAPVRIVSYRGGVRTEDVVPKHAAITTHAGRRTFVVHALRLGIPVPVIMEWTGHSCFQAMKPYVKIVDSAKADNMALFDRDGAGKGRPEKRPENGSGDGGQPEK